MPSGLGGKEVANGFANELRSTAGHGALLARRLKITNQSTRLATGRHRPIRES